MENKDKKSVLEKNVSNDIRICKILKTKGIRYHIGTTEDRHQSIDLVFNAADTTYSFFIDASPLNDGTNEGKEKNEAMLKVYGLNG